MINQNNRYLGDLRQLINQYYRPDELRLLCTALGLNYDHLPGDTKLLKVNTLLRQYDHSGQMAELLLGLRSQNPDVHWPEIPVSRRPQDRLRSNGAKHEPKSILQQHLNELKRQLLNNKLSSSQPGSDVRKNASELTLETLHRLDNQRKKELVLFLWETRMIIGPEPMIDLSGADLCKVNLSWTNLYQANLSRVNLSRADLSLANLQEANLSGANLRGASLRAHLVGADLVGADLRECNLSGARLAEANLAGANLRLANLSEADLVGANLVGADMRLANLHAADLSEAYLPWANMRLVNLRGAAFREADLSGADLRGAEMFADQLKDAANLENTSFSNGRGFNS